MALPKGGVHIEESRLERLSSAAGVRPMAEQRRLKVLRCKLGGLPNEATEVQLSHWGFQQLQLAQMR